MRINRAVGFILFVLLGQLVLHDIFSATSRAVVATMGSIEVAGNTFTHSMLASQDKK